MYKDNALCLKCTHYKVNTKTRQVLPYCRKLNTIIVTLRTECDDFIHTEKQERLGDKKEW